MALPEKRIKSVTPPDNQIYEIVPEMLGKDGFSAELPTLTNNVILATLDDVYNIYQHYITFEISSDKTVVSCKVLTHGNLPMTASEFAQFLYDELPDSTGKLTATGTVKINAMDHKYVAAIGKGSSNANILVYPVISTGGYDSAVTIAASSITSFVDIVNRIGAHGAGASGSSITGQDVVNALGYTPTHVEANPGTTSASLTGITIGSTNYAVSAEPDAYLKSASSSGNTLTLTNKDNTTTTFTPTFSESHVGDVVTVGATNNSGIAITGTTANPTVGIASTHKLPTTSEWNNKANDDEVVHREGDTMIGQLVAQNNIAYTTAQVRNIILSTSEPTSTDGGNGDIWIVYKE